MGYTSILLLKRLALMNWTYFYMYYVVLSKTLKKLNSHRFFLYSKTLTQYVYR